MSGADYETFYHWRADVLEMHIWTSSRKVPTWEEFVGEMEQLLRNSMTFLVLNKRDSRPIGFVQAYNLNPQEGWCFTLAYTDRKYRRGHGAEAYVGLLDSLFRSFPFRKVYADVFAFNVDSVKPLMSGGFVEEGRFRQHSWFRDRYWDVIRLAMYREDWYRFRERTHFLLGVVEEASELLEEEQTQRGDGVQTQP